MRVLFALLTSLAIAPAAMAQAKPVTTASGLVYESIKDGAGESPKATDTVKVREPLKTSPPDATPANATITA